MFKKLFTKHIIHVMLNQDEFIFKKDKEELKEPFDNTFLKDDKLLNKEIFEKILAIFEKNIKILNGKSLIKPTLHLKVDFYKDELNSQMQQSFLNELMLTLVASNYTIEFKC